MDYKTLRDMWVPEDATIVLETDEDADMSIPRYVVYAHDGIMRVCRFFYFTATGQWNASVDNELDVRDLV